MDIDIEHDPAAKRPDEKGKFPKTCEINKSATTLARTPPQLLLIANLGDASAKPEIERMSLPKPSMAYYSLLSHINHPAFAAVYIYKYICVRIC